MIQKKGFRIKYEELKKELCIADSEKSLKYGPIFLYNCLMKSCAGFHAARLAYMSESTRRKLQEYETKYGNPILKETNVEKLNSTLKNAERQFWASYAVTFQGFSGFMLGVTNSNNIPDWIFNNSGNKTIAAMIVGGAYALASSNLGVHMNWKSEVQMNAIEKRLTELKSIDDAVRSNDSGDLAK